MRTNNRFYNYLNSKFNYLVLFVLVITLLTTISACGDVISEAQTTTTTSVVMLSPVVTTAAPSNITAMGKVATTVSNKEKTTTAATANAKLIGTPQPTDIKTYSMDVEVQVNELGKASVSIDTTELATGVLIVTVNAFNLNPDALNFYLRQHYGIGNKYGKSYGIVDNYFKGAVNDGVGGKSFMFEGKLKGFGTGYWLTENNLKLYSKADGYQQIVITFK